MTRGRQTELKFQDHIIQSYKNYGGYGRKWASDMQAGVQDLIVTLPGRGVHLAEVKHRPDWKDLMAEYQNPLTELQKKMAREYEAGGGLSIAYTVIGSTKAIGSYMAIHSATAPFISLGIFTPYVAGMGFNVKWLLDTYLPK